jgi:hypothetical protein
MGAVVDEARRLTRGGLSRDRADRRRSDGLWRRSAGHAHAGPAGAQDPEARAGLKRLRFPPSIPSKPMRSDARHRRGRAADAAFPSLRAVGRRHDPEAHEAPPFARDTIAFCEEVRRLRPDAAFGADLIAGFPTETERCSRTRCALVDDAGLSYLHVFPFSPRKGTPAARMPQLRARDREGARRAPAAHGRTRSPRGSRRWSEASRNCWSRRTWLGRTPCFAPARFGATAGAFCAREARITARAGNHLLAEPRA